MRLTHFGHSCLLAEINGSTVLFDPGTFSHGFEGITGLDAILLTHQHPDHADPTRLGALIDQNPGAALCADPQTAALLGRAWRAVHAGSEFDIGELHVTGAGGTHAVIHPDLPVLDNTAYLLGSADDPAQLMHPGDSLFVPEQTVGVLAIPSVAPWMKISETVDYLRAVAPRVAVPIHQGIVNDAGKAVYYARLREMGPAGTEFRVLPAESCVELS